MDLLFIDNPIGAGFSYIEGDDNAKYATTNQQIGEDLVAFTKGFMEKHPDKKRGNSLPARKSLEGVLNQEP